MFVIPNDNNMRFLDAFPLLKPGYGRVLDPDAGTCKKKILFLREILNLYENDPPVDTAHVQIISGPLHRGRSNQQYYSAPTNSALFTPR